MLIIHTTQTRGTKSLIKALMYSRTPYIEILVSIYSHCPLFLKESTTLTLCMFLLCKYYLIFRAGVGRPKYYRGLKRGRGVPEGPQKGLRNIFRGNSLSSSHFQSVRLYVRQVFSKSNVITVLPY